MMITFLRVFDIEAGMRVDLKYERKSVMLLRTGNPDELVVLESTDSHLHVGDVLSVMKFRVSYPVFIHSLRRGEENLGSMTLAKISGVQSISLYNE